MALLVLKEDTSPPGKLSPDNLASNGLEDNFPGWGRTTSRNNKSAGAQMQSQQDNLASNDREDNFQRGQLGGYQPTGQLPWGEEDNFKKRTTSRGGGR